MLATWSKHPSFTLILTLFSRPFAHPQLPMIVGDFTSTVLLEVEGGPGSFLDRSQRLQARLAACIDHMAVSGVRVLREWNRRLAPERRILPVVFTSLLGHQPPREEEGAAPTVLDNPVHGITQTPQVWLDLQIREERGSLCFNLDAIEDRFPAGLLDDMFGAFCRSLAPGRRRDVLDEPARARPGRATGAASTRQQHRGPRAGDPAPRARLRPGRGAAGASGRRVLDGEAEL